MKKLNRKQSRILRVRSRLMSAGRPRLTIFRSNLHIWAQIVDDLTSKTIVAVNTKTLESKKGETKTVKATRVGTKIAQLALEKKITKIVFDRGSYKFHGRVKALAEAARTAGLEF
ncbi:50S ribosomal protein L18 [Candidatus Collierbacteria bacterium CG10_big_fil_rev_8_21_14_0_10_44_9]|uniref:Large ribosomal subunit protein uL18 n=1 Tax=Candidatus Collierbacteria bacterium CG10_big_fil_rev_8_21_14_0_10_44_9 TaxID=1974535 RepID=A0A2H0VLS0_9BACT|nr:MAG: 50S ribosomal protein L18 [Candidatus Collierbacteria bacterium CG10_big_fil_rev_8_21_14_0_10_44_9]